MCSLSGEMHQKGKIKQVQRYRCASCGKTQQSIYTKPRIPIEKQEWVQRLNNEGCGISSIGRLLQMSKSSVQRIIIKISNAIQIPVYQEYNQIYEIDELRTYCGNKNQECWVMYAINRVTGKVIAIETGRRTKENINKIITKVLSLVPKKIYTDGLNIYKKYSHAISLPKTVLLWKIAPKPLFFEGK
jgi:hypothetical protein